MRRSRISRYSIITTTRYDFKGSPTQWTLGNSKLFRSSLVYCNSDQEKIKTV